jgi:hypothetical protein
MCRSIRTLYNLEPPASEDEILAAATQFVRKLSGYAKPSRANEAAFAAAVDAIAAAAHSLLETLETAAPARSRADQEAKGRARAARRSAP